MHLRRFDVRKLLFVLGVSIGFALVVVGGALLVSRVLDLSTASSGAVAPPLVADQGR